MKEEGMDRLLSINAWKRKKKRMKRRDVTSGDGVAWDAESRSNVCKCHLNGIHFSSRPHPHATAREHS